MLSKLQANLSNPNKHTQKTATLHTKKLLSYLNISHMTETVKLQVNNLNQAVPNNNPKTEYNEHVGLNSWLIFIKKQLILQF